MSDDRAADVIDKAFAPHFTRVAQKALDALAAEGFVVVDLPEPSWDDDAPGVFWDLGGAVVECDGSRISLGRELGQPGLRMTTTDACDLAAALLAAAAKAEGTDR